MSYLEKKEWAAIEEKLAAIEQQIATIEEQMLRAASDYDQLAQYQKELDQRNLELLEAYERFDYLSELEE